jgi:hypothetical protein
VQVGFADKLKILAVKTLGYTDLSDAECIALMDVFKEEGFVRANGRDIDTSDITGRKYLQNLGNEAREIFGDTFWIDQVLPDPTSPAPFVDLARKYPTAELVAITDLRYPNEAERVRNLGGEVWEVLRPGTASDGHASEKPLPRHLVNRQIVNDRGLLDLEWEVNKALELAGIPC